jgi:ATP-dependent DNA helicase DinG
MSDENHVYWCETRRKGVFLKATPIDVSATLKNTLFEKQDTIVLTSATLAADNGFTYIKERLGISTAPQLEEDTPYNVPDELILPSPFDYKSRVRYYLPALKCEPSAPDFAKESAKHMLKLVLACGGRTFLLFTSNRNMKEVYGLIHDKIPYKTFIQGDLPKSQILKGFIEDKSSVLFATMSFWGGVDVQGDSLICVIIDKLPFASPGEPLVEAKINLIKMKNGNPFFDFQVPQAIITLKQGLGRLVRKKDDYGILSVLDRRLHTKGYGKKFLSCIPKAKISANINEVEIFLKSLVE